LGYTYTWYANDTFGNEDNTGPLIYVVTRATPAMSFTLNGVEDNINIQVGDSVDMDVSIITGDSDALIQIYENIIALGNDVASGNGGTTYSRTFNTEGVYTYHAFYSQSENYSQDSIPYTITVSTNPGPQSSNNIATPASGSIYSLSQTYQFDIEWDDQDGIGDVWIEHNFYGTPQNYTYESVNGNQYTYTIEGLNANPTGYTYTWYANDTLGSVSQASTQIYVIHKEEMIGELRIGGNVVNDGETYTALEGEYLIEFTNLQPPGTFNTILNIPGITSNPVFDSTPYSSQYSFPIGTSTITWTILGNTNYNNTGGIVTFEGLDNPEETKDIFLSSGLNTFSVPLILQDYSINNIFGFTLQNVNGIYGYSPSTGWQIYSSNPKIQNTLTELDPKKGYFVNVDSPIVVSITGNVTNETGDVPEIDLEQGWNFVGIHDINNQIINDVIDTDITNYTEAWEYDDNSQQYVLLDPLTDSFDSGRGYWVYIEDTASRFGPPGLPLFEILRRILF
jgi:hypothetical protein